MDRADELSRREAMVALGALAVSTQVPFHTSGEETKAKAGIALQLYTLRDAAKADLPGTLKKAR